MVPTLNTSIYEVIFINTYSYPTDNKMAPVISGALSVDRRAVHDPIPVSLGCKSLAPLVEYAMSCEVI